MRLTTKGLKRIIREELEGGVTVPKKPGYWWVTDRVGDRVICRLDWEQYDTKSWYTITFCGNDMVFSEKRNPGIVEWIEWVGPAPDIW